MTLKYWLVLLSISSFGIFVQLVHLMPYFVRQQQFELFRQSVFEPWLIDTVLPLEDIICEFLKELFFHLGIDFEIVWKEFSVVLDFGRQFVVFISMFYIELNHHFVAHLGEIRNIVDELFVSNWECICQLNLDKLIELLGSLFPVWSTIEDAKEHQHWNRDIPLIQLIVIQLNFFWIISNVFVFVESEDLVEH